MKWIRIIFIALLFLGSFFVLIKTGKIKLSSKKYIVKCHLKTDKYTSINNDFDNFLIYDKEVINISEYDKAESVINYYQTYPRKVDKLTEDRKVKLKKNNC